MQALAKRYGALSADFGYCYGDCRTPRLRGDQALQIGCASHGMEVVVASGALGSIRATYLREKGYAMLATTSRFNRHNLNDGRGFWLLAPTAVPV